MIVFDLLGILCLDYIEAKVSDDGVPRLLRAGFFYGSLTNIYLRI